jgi:hypothetical protein
LAQGREWPAIVACAGVSGAPPGTHLRTRFTAGLSGKDGAFKHILAGFDANSVIIHLDDLDQGLQVGLSKRHRSGGERLTHAPAEPLNERGIDPDSRSNMGYGGP